jgi:AraC family cel operon transcriptional repressor
MESEVVDLGIMPVPFSSRLTSSNDEFTHRHGFIEVFYILSGEITHLVNGKSETLKTGDFRVICPGTIHCFQRLGPCTHRDFLLRPDLFDRAANAIDKPFFDSLMKEGEGKAKIETVDIVFLEEKTNDFFSTLEVESQKKMEYCIALILLSIFYSFSSRVEIQNSFKSECLLAISDNFVYPDASTRVRATLSYNDKYFCKKFKENFNTNLVNFINQKKMEYARYLLMVTNDSIDSIRAQVGIESLSHFHKLFRNAFNETPAKTRKQINALRHDV